jgi:hypothetical protein
LIEWVVRKFTGYDPEIGSEGYADTYYSLTLEPRFGTVWQVMYGWRVVSTNPQRVVQPDHYQATYPADLDLPFSVVSVYVVGNSEAADNVADNLSRNSVVFTLAEWNTMESYLNDELLDEEIQDMFLDPDNWRGSDCLSVAFILKTLLEKARVISDGAPFDLELIARLDETFKQEVEELEIAHAE